MYCSRVNFISVSKCTPVQALRLCTDRTAHKGSRDIALLFLDRGTRRRWGVSVTPLPLFTPGKDPVPIVQETGWALGPVWTGAENLSYTGTRSPYLPARSQSLYRLSYPSHGQLYTFYILRLRHCRLLAIFQPFTAQPVTKSYKFCIIKVPMHFSHTAYLCVTQLIGWCLEGTNCMFKRKKVKVKWPLYRPGVAQRVGRGIALLFHDHGTRRGVSGQQHAPAALYPRERTGTHFTGGWEGPRAGLDGRKISSPPRFDPGPSSP